MLRRTNAFIIEEDDPPQAELQLTAGMAENDVREPTAVTAYVGKLNSCVFHLCSLDSDTTTLCGQKPVAPLTPSEVAKRYRCRKCDPDQDLPLTRGDVPPEKRRKFAQ